MSELATSIHVLKQPVPDQTPPAVTVETWVTYVAFLFVCGLLSALILLGCLKWQS